MSVSNIIKLPDLVIPNGAAVSNTYDNNVHGDAAIIALISPASLPETVKWFGSIDGTTYVAIQTGATLTDITVPAASKGTTYGVELLAFPYLQLHSTSGNVAGARTFQMAKHYTTSH